MVKRSDHSTSSTDKEVVADQAAKLKAKDAPLGQLQDVLPGTEIGWVATEVEGAQLPDVGMQPAADTPQATATVDSDLSVATDAGVTQPHAEQLEEPVTEAPVLSGSASSSGVEQVAGASAWLGDVDEVGVLALAGAAQPGLAGNNFTVPPLPSVGSIPALNVHVGVDGEASLDPQVLSTLTASGDTTGQLREDGQQIASGQLNSAGASGAVSWQLDHSAGLYGQLQLSGDGQWRYTLDNASSKVQGLCAGEQVSEHFIAAVTDSAGRTQFIPLTIAIDGSADHAIISGTDVGQANEDKLLLVSGMLTVQDADAGQAQFKPAVLTGSFGLLTLDTVGHWVYGLDNANPAVQALGAGKAATDVLTVTSIDGTTHHVTITVHGSNDQALIVGAHSGALTEDSLLSVQGRLNVTDIDQGEASFVPQTLAGTFGQLQLDMAGHWTYLLDNTNPAVQALGAGAAATDMLTVTTLDGTPQQITITIKGSNDAAQIAGTLTGAVTEESTLIAKGTLTVTDVDQGQDRFNPEVFNGQYGSFSLDANGHWLYVLDNSNAAVQGLAAGEQVRDVMTVTSVDGTSCQLVVSVNGSNDAPVLTAQSQTVTEDGTRLSGRMVATDVDTSDTHVFSTANAVDGFTLNADGSYSFDPSNAAYQHLAAGQTQDVVIPVTVTDSAGATSTQNLNITVTGVNDGAVISGVSSGTITEDQSVRGGQLQASGQLTVTDVDTGEDHFIMQTGVAGSSGLGHFSLDATGAWTYTADNTQTAIQQLKAGESLTDMLSVTSADGATHMLTVTLQGSNDVPVLTAQTQAVTEDGAQLQGRMVATDVDAGDTFVFSTANAVDGFTLNSDGSYSFDPAHAAYQHLSAGQTQDVVIPVTVTDSNGATATQSLTITVTGTNDAAVVGGRLTNTLTEDSVVSTGGMLRAGGQLTVLDPDAGEAVFVVEAGVTGAGHYGSFSIDASGHYSYIADNTQAAIQQLKAGETLTDRFTVATADGTQQVVTITINGAEDRPVLHAQTHAVTEDGTRLTGQMLATDVDAGDTQRFSTPQAVAGFTLNADGSYSFDPSNAAYQRLAAGQTQDVVIPVTVTDSAGATATQNLNITVTGVNDGAVISGVSSGTITEDQSVQGGQLQASGQLTVTDVDTGEDHFIAQTDVVGSSGLGHFSLDATGAWNYTADNTQTAIQQLKAGESLTDTLSVASADGATHMLTVTIQGSNDVPVLSAQTQAVTEGGAKLQGRMIAIDVDPGDTFVFSIANAVDGFTLNADGGYSFDPAHAAYQHLSAGQTQDVVIPVTVTDSAGATSTQNLTITVSGSNDGATIAGVNTGATVEDKPQAVTGQLTIADVDDGQAHFVAQSGVAGTYGTFTLNEQGQWSYQLDNSKPAVQALKTGDSVTDSFTLTSADGTAHQVTVTVTGKDDGAVIGGTDTAVVSEDGNVNAGHLDATGQLTIIDPDAGQSQFIAQTATPGTYGEFTIDATGAWHYQANNSRTEIQLLKVGESLTDTLTVTSTDGTTHQIQITINGTNDAPTLTAQAQAVSEDGAQLTGHMVATDVDQGDSQIYSNQNPPAGFTLNADGSYSFDPSNAAYQHLIAGQTQDVVIPITVTDSAGSTSTQNLTITVTGTNDGASIAGVSTGTASEDSQQAVTGLLTVADVDDGQAHFLAQSNTAGSYGSFTLNEQGQWSYQLDNSKPAVQVLKTGDSVTDSFTVTSADGTVHQVTVTVTGNDDGAVIGGADTGAVSEDQSATLSASGTLSISDPDAGQDHFTAQANAAGTYGSFNIDASGYWTYSADNSQTAVQQLKAGDTLTDSFTVTSADGTSHTVSVTLNGSNDAPTLTAQAQAVSEDGAQLTGHMVATDVDQGDTQSFRSQNPPAGFTLNTDGSYAFDPSDAVYQHLAAGQTQTLTIPITVTDSAGATSTQNLTITLTGSNDCATIAGVNTGATTEDNTQAVTGQLTVADVDYGQAHFVAQSSSAGTYGTFSLNEQGQWSYALDNSKPGVQALKTGDSVTDSFTVTSADGTTHQVSVTVTGKDDGAVIAGTDAASVIEDQSVQGGQLQASGQLTVTDPDVGQDHFTAQTNAAGTYGTFTVDATGHWTYSADNTPSAVQSLKAGATLTDTLTVTSADGTSHTVTVTLNGTNDTPTLTAQAQSVTEDGARLTGHMVATDVDQGDTQAFSTQNPPVGFTLSADGSYSFDPSDAAYQHLAAGQTQDVVIPITVTDSAGATSTQNLTITVTGINDGATIAGPSTGTTVEDSTQVVTGKLTVADVDDNQSSFVAQTGAAGTYGSFTLAADGSWNYSLDNSKPGVQALKTGDSVTDSFTVTSADGTTHQVSVTVTGKDDGAVIGGADAGAVTEDTALQSGQLQVVGQLTITDPDTAQDHFTAQTNTAGTYGTFNIDKAGQWTYSADNSQSAIQSLKAGATLTDTLTVTSADGTAHTVTVTLTGSNDAPTLTAQTQAVTEDGAKLTGHMVATDVDAGDTQAFSSQNPPAGFTLNADGSYAFAPSDAAYQHLTAGQTQDVVIPITVTDSAGATSTQNLTITVTGTNDGAVIGGRLANFVTEDAVVSTTGMLRAGGQLTVADPDAGEAAFVAQTGVTGVGHYGSFSIDASGHYSYDADNTQAAIQQLKAGETLTDRFTVTTADGTQQVVTITINGAEDKPVLQAQTHAVTEDGARLTGKMLATDVDAGDTQRFSVAHPVAGFVLNPDGSFSFNPATASYQNLASGQTQDVVIPVTVIDSAGGTSTQNLTITVTGVNDRAVISGVSNGTITEDQSVSATHTLNCGGKLDVTDVDTGEAAFAVQHSVGANGYGNFVLGSSGNWTYSADNSQTAIQQLKAGDTLTDTFTVNSTDGTTHTVTVTIQGSNDVPVLAAQTQAVTEGGAQLQGHMVATDVDAGDTHVFSTAQVTDGFTLSADGSYSFDPSHASYQHLATGQTQNLVIPITVTDSPGLSSTQNLTITLTGSNDGATIAGTDSGTVTEDSHIASGKISTSGTLTVTDPDVGQDHFNALVSNGHYGVFTLDAAGQWTYSADNSKPDIQHLKAGDTLTDSFTVTSADGTAHTVTVTVAGSNDAPVLAAQTQAVTEDGAQLQGHMAATDVDAGDTHVFSTAQVIDGFTLNADGSYSFDPANAAYQHLAAGQTQNFVIPITVTDSAGATSTQNLTITLTGTNDSPTISGINSGATIEDNTQAVTGQLTISDVDDGQAHFVAQSGVAGTYGTFTLNEQGLWSYTLDNSKPEVQAIKAGDSVTDSFTVTSADGSTHQVTVTVTGKDDGAVIGGSDSATVTEDSNAQSGQLQAGGTLTVIDPDAGQDHFTAQTNAAGTYGNFSIDATGHWGYSADNSQAAIQQLKSGDTLTDSFTVMSADGTSHTVTVTLNGSNDAPTLTALAQAVTEDGASLTGHMVATDLDTGDTQAFSTQNPPAGFTLNADGSYSFDPADAAYQHLAAGQTQTLTIPITVTDSAGATSTQNLAITLTGTNDTPTIAGVSTGASTEDSAQAVTGQLTVADVDDGQAHFVAQSGSAGTYGSFSLNEQGQWSYSLDNSKPSVQALKAGESVTDSFTVSSADGTNHTVTVTVNGSNDAATITGADQLTVQEDTRIQAGGNLAVGGKIDVADVDSGEAQFNAQLHAVGTGGYGEFNVMANGAWTYSAANSQVAIQQLRDGQTLTDSLQVTSADGTSHTITVTINGKDDKAVISGDISGMTPDDDSAISGVLTITDPDAGQAQFVAQVDRPGIYGSFSVTADGHWTYTPDSRADVLKAGESHADNMIVTSADGTQKFVLITVTGSQDGAVIGGVVSGDVTEDTASSVTGRLTIDDPDAGEAAFKPGSTTGSYGGLFLKSDGEWTYNLDNTNAKVQALAPGESLTDEVTVASADGTPQKITITISGTIDTPTLSAAQETTHFNPTDASAVVRGTSPVLHQVILTGLDTAAIEQGGQLDLTLVAAGASANFNAMGIGVGVTGASSAQIEKGETLVIQLQGATRSASLQLNTFTDRTLSTVGSDDDQAHWVAYDHLGNKVAEGDVLPDRDPAQNGRIDIQTTQPFSYIAIQATDNTRDSFVGNSRFVVKSVDAALIQYDTKIDLSGHLTDQPGSETLSYRISGLDASASFNHGTLNADGSWTISTSESQDLHLLHGADQTLHIEAIATAAGVSASSVPVDLKVTTAGMSYELISGNHRAQTDEDARSPVGGTLHVDTDAATVPGFMAQHVTTAYGAFDLKADGHWTYSVNSVALQSMSSADSQHETFTVATSNGVQREVTVDIKGLDDATVVGGQLSGDVTEDSHTTTQGRMTFTDVDTDLSKISAIAHTYTGLYGTLNVDADGSWSYSLDPAKANVLKAGEVVHDVFATVAVKTDQGAFSRTRIDISVHGDNDGAVIGGTDTGSVTEDRNLTAGKLATSGQLTVTDQDAGQDHFTAQTDTATTYGHFSIDASGHWTYAADNSQLAIQQLKTGDSLTDTLSVTSADGTLHTVTVSIHGVNDAPAIGTTRASARLVIEDAPTSSITGLLYGRDTDAGDTLTWSVSGNGQGTYGHLALDTQSGRWTYQLDNADADTNTLRAGQQGQEVFQITVTDSTGASGTSVVRVMVIGTDDRAVIAGVDTGSVTEDTAVQSGQLKASGQLTVSDVDTGEEHFTVQTDVATAYGLVSIDAAGHWTYAADNSQAAIQQLKAGDTLTDTLTVTSAGGTQHTLTITLQGQDDQTVIGGVDTGTVSEDGVLQATGQLSISDADGGDAAFQARPRVPGQHGVFGLATDGSWIYALNNSDTDVQALSKGQSLSDSLVVKSVDGSTHTITVSIEGRDDSAVIAGVNTGRVTEDQSVQAGQLQASGQLTLTDADAGQHLFTVQNQVAGHYGSFSIDASGAWIYTADNSQDAVQQLGRNDSLSERFRVTSDDGSQHIVLVTLQGSNDAPVVLAQTRSVTEDGAMLTGQMRASDIDIHDRLQFSTTAQIAGFTLAADGSYSFDPRASAYQNLGSGVDETLRIPVTVRDPFGAQHTRDLLITVTGTNDGAIIQGRDTGDVVEDLNPVGGLLRTQGQLTVRDPDAAQSSFVAQTDVVGRYGHFSIDAAGAWTYQADNASTRVQELREGAQAMDHFVVRSLDGSTHSIRISVHGTNDAPVVTATAQSVTEDGALLFGQLRVNDRDRGDQQLFQLDHPVAGFTLSDDGSYRFDPKDPAHQDLREGQVMRLDVPVTVTDSAGEVVHQTLSITLTGRNDGAMISGVDSAVVTEDVALQNGLLQASGQLQVSDIDDGEANFAVQAGVAGHNGLGYFSIQAGGQWIYTADNTQAAVQQLKAGESLTDTLTVASADGTTHTLTVTLQGSNDAPVLQAQTQAVTEDGAQLSGRLSATDADAGDTQVFSAAQAVDGLTLNANGSYSFDPAHASYQHLTAGQTQDVVIPITVTDSAGLSSTQNLTITVTGSNDGPQVVHATAATAADLGAINEDTPRVFTEAELLQAVGATDVDDGASLHIVAGSLTSAHGTFTGDATTGFTFTPVTNFSGQDVDLQFSVTDGTVAREAHAQLDITPVADAPIRVTAPTITTDFNSISVGAPGWKQTDPSPTGWHTDESGGVEIGQERLYGGSGNNQILSLTASWGNNIYRELPIKAGEAVHLGFDLSARPGFAVTPLEVLWEGKVIDTITPVAGSYSMQHHDYDLLATGSNSRLELRASGKGEARVLIDNLQIGPPEHVVLGDHDTLLKPYLGFQLVDTDGSETLSFGVHGLPVGFTLTDGTHSVTVAATDQVIETAGWNQDALAVRAPQDFQGTVNIQVTAHAEEGSTHQMANAADLTLALRLVPVSHAAVISGENAITLTEDQNVNSHGLLEHFGQLNISDSDAGQAIFVAQNAVGTQYGHYTIGQDGYWLYEADNQQPAIQQLKTGESLTDSFTVHSADGTAQTITVTIQGQDDAAAFVPQAQVSSPDVYMQIGVQLLSSEHREFQFMAEVLLGNMDPLSYITAEMSFTNTGVALRSPDGSLSMVYQAEGGMTSVPVMDLRSWHNKGQGYDVVLVDANGMQVNVFPHDQGDPDKMSGFNQYVTGFSGPFNSAVSLQPDMHAASYGAPVQGSTVVPAIAPVQFDSAHVLEDNGQQVSGFIEVQDPDKGQSSMQPMTDHHSAHGTFSIDINGDWVYQLDSSRPDVQALKDGETLLETITVHSADGTPHEVNITIHGQNDGAVIGGADTGRVVEDQNVTAAGLIEAHGQLMVSDLDAGEAQFMPIQDLAGKFGHLSLNTDGSWVYQADNSSAAVQALGKGQSATERFTVHSVEGTAHEVSVTLQGADEAQSNHAPTATEGADLGWVHNNDSISFSQWDLLSKVQAQDADSSDRLQVVGLHIDPYYGRVDQLADGGFRFTPTAGLARLDEPFTIEISDGHSTTTTHATLDVIAVQTSSAPPVAPEAHVAPIEATASFSPVEGASGASDDHENHAASSNLGGNGNNFAEAHSDSHQADSDYIAQGHQAGQSHDGLAASDDVAVTFAAGSQFAPVHDYLQFAGSAMPAAAMGEHSGTSNSAVHEYLAAAGIDSLTPTADEMHMPPTAVLMDLQHAGVSGEHTAANEQSVDPAADDLAAIENPLADDPNQHHGGI